MQCFKCKSGELTVVKTEYGKNLVCFNCARQLGSLLYFLRRQAVYANRILPPKKVSEPSVACPKCNENFEKKLAINTQFECIIDVCYKCGLIWYDKSELEELFHPSLKREQRFTPNRTGQSIQTASKQLAAGEVNYVESEEDKKKAMILAIHQNSGLSLQDKAKVIDFIINGPKIPKKDKETRTEFSWWDIFDTDGDGDGFDGDGGDGD